MGDVYHGENAEMVPIGNSQNVLTAPSREDVSVIHNQTRAKAQQAHPFLYSTFRSQPH
jgi:hypothetical protein